MYHPTLVDLLDLLDMIPPDRDVIIQRYLTQNILIYIPINAIQ